VAVPVLRCGTNPDEVRLPPIQGEYMKPTADFDPKATAKKLMREARSGALATLMAGAGDPYCSLVNVATAADGTPLLLISRLAIHTKNILADPRASLMLDERKEGDPLQGARVMLMGVVTKTESADARRRYLACQPEAEMFGHIGHGRNELQGIVDGHLCRMAQSGVDIAVQHIINSEHIGDEEPIELAALQGLGEMDPIVEILVLPRLIARMPPEARRLVTHAVHVEGVQPDFAAHIVIPACSTNTFQAPTVFLLMKLKARTAKMRVPVPTCCQ